MWNIKFFVIPVITGAIGNVTKGLKEYLETISGKHSVDPLQKNSCTTRDTAHNKQGATILILKRERWGVPLVEEEKYQGKGNL
jgi:hypothetical protein